MMRSVFTLHFRSVRPLLLSIVVLLTGVLGTGCGSAGGARQGSSASSTEVATSGQTESAEQPAQEQQTTSEDPIKVLRLEKVQQRLESAAQDWYGTPYDWGGESKEGVDCSGFVQNLYEEAFAYGLPRVTETQLQSGPSVERDQIRPGDLVFFRPENEYNHVGVYMGDDTFVHASSSNGVTESPIDRDYWQRYYWTARRPLKPSTIPDTLSSQLLAYRYPDSDSTVQVTEAADQPQPSDAETDSEETVDAEEQTDQATQASDAEESEGTKIASCDAEGVDCADPSSANTTDSDEETTRKGW